MISRIAARLAHARAYVTAPAAPVLSPYTQPLAPFRAKLRRVIWLTIFTLVGAIYGFFYALLPPAFLLFMLAPIGFLGLIIIWALPNSNKAPPVRALKFLFFGFVLAMLLWPNYLAIALPGLPWISMRRLFAAPLAILLLATFSTSERFRNDIKETLAAAPLIGKFVIAFVVVQFLSIFFSSAPVAAVKAFLNYQFFWTAIFFTGLYLFRFPGNIERLIASLCLCGIFLAIMSLFEFHNKQVLWANHIPSFLRVDDESVMRTLSGVVRAGEYRVQTTFSVALSYGEYLALIMPFFLHKIVTSRNNIVRLLCLAGDLLLMTSAVLTQTRVAMVGALVAHSTYGLVWAIRRWRGSKVSIFGPALTLAYPALLVAVGGVVMAVDALRFRVLGGGSNQASNDAREMQWTMAGPQLMHSPVVGHGPAQGASALGYTNSGGIPTLDSYYLSILLDYGIAGFVLYYGLIIMGILKAVEIGSRSKNEELAYALPIAISLSTFIVIKFVLSQEDNSSILFLFLAAIVAMLHRLRQEEEPKPTAAPMGRR